MNVSIVITDMCQPTGGTFWQNKIYEVLGMRKTQLAEKASDKRGLIPVCRFLKMPKAIVEGAKTTCY